MTTIIHSTVTAPALTSASPMSRETTEGISFSFSTDITGSSAVTEIDADLIPDGKIYTLQGIRINRITSTGIYIIDGKKVFVRK